MAILVDAVELRYRTRDSGAREVQVVLRRGRSERIALRFVTTQANGKPAPTCDQFVRVPQMRPWREDKEPTP